eukprot:303152-Rhodomonas_salina.2
MSAMLQRPRAVREHRRQMESVVAVSSGCGVKGRVLEKGYKLLRVADGQAMLHAARPRNWVAALPLLHLSLPRSFSLLLCPSLSLLLPLSLSTPPPFVLYGSALPGTERAYGATRARTQRSQHQRGKSAICYARPTRCPVLTYGMLLPGGKASSSQSTGSS